jgi:hypothetical protein
VKGRELPEKVACAFRLKGRGASHKPSLCKGHRMAAEAVLLGKRLVIPVETIHASSCLHRPKGGVHR